MKNNNTPFEREVFFFIALILACILATKHFILVEKYAYPFIYVFLILIISSFNNNVFFQVIKSKFITVFFIFSFYLVMLLPSFSLNIEDIRTVGYQFLYIIIFAGMAATFFNKKIPVIIKYFFAFLMFFYIIFSFNENLANHNKQIYAYVIFSFFPYTIIDNGTMHDSLGRVSNKTLFLIVVCSILLFLIFKARIPAAAFIIFLMSVVFWDSITKNKRTFNILYFSYIVLLIGAVFMYIYAVNMGYISDYDDFSQMYFEKGFSGRATIWPEVMSHIYQDLWFGKCSTCITDNYMNFSELRNLSSHNTFMEIAFRSGIIGFVLLVFLYYTLMRHFFRFKTKMASRIGGSYLLAALLFQSSGELMFFNSILANVLVWGFLGVCFGRSTEFKFHPQLQYAEAFPVPKHK